MPPAAHEADERIADMQEELKALRYDFEDLRLMVIDFMEQYN